MGWEIRKGNRYYYIARKLDGRVVRKYVVRESSPLAAKAAILMADGERRQREEHEARRRESADFRARVGELLRSAAEANADLGVAVEAMLLAIGYHRINRGVWRMARKKRAAGQVFEGVEGPDLAADGFSVEVSGNRPAAPVIPAGVGKAIVVHTAPEGDRRATDLFARVRAGDPSARRELRQWLSEHSGQLDHYGDLAKRATLTLIGKATGGDPVWRIAVEEKLSALNQELLGPNPTVLDRLVVRRILNGWVAVHALELEQAVNPPARMRDREHLESAISKASKRLTAAVADLARVRRLQLPSVLVNITPPTRIASPPPRVADAEVLDAVGVERGKATKKSAMRGRQGKAA